MTQPLPGALDVVRDFALDAGERAAKTFAQAMITIIGGSALDVVHFDWRSALAVSAGAAVLSVLTSVASGVRGTGTASLTGAVVPRAAVSPTVLGYGEHAASMEG